MANYNWAGSATSGGLKTKLRLWLKKRARNENRGSFPLKLLASPLRFQVLRFGCFDIVSK